MAYSLDSASAAVQALNSGQIVTDSFTVQSLDGTAQVLTISVTDADERVLTGTAGNDTLTGTAISEALFGLAERDSLAGNSGGDTLDGGSGADSLYGGDGGDRTGSICRRWLPFWAGATMHLPLSGRQVSPGRVSCAMTRQRVRSRAIRMAIISLISLWI